MVCQIPTEISTSEMKRFNTLQSREQEDKNSEMKRFNTLQSREQEDKNYNKISVIVHSKSWLYVR